MADYITNFDATLTGSAVKIDLKMKNGTNKYSISETASMRNRMITYP